MNTDPTKIKAYLIGGGIASLAGAVYLIQDGHIPGENISIFERSEQTGGSLDSHNSPEKGYISRGYRIFEEKVYANSYDLWSRIPSLNDPKITVKNEIDDFNRKVKIFARARLIDRGKKIDADCLGISKMDKINLIKLLISPESFLATSTIEDNFSTLFFKTNFWFETCTLFAFQPWHSAVEFKRYLLRSAHNVPFISNMTSGRSTPYNQYDSIILPIVTWLRKRGVYFEMGSEVIDLVFKTDGAQKTAERIDYLRNGEKSEVKVHKKDIVFATIGSMTSNSSFGSMTSAPQLNTAKPGADWKLWEKIAKNRPEFGKPSVFTSAIDRSKFESFTITFRDPRFFEMMEKLTGNKPGTGGGVTFKNSGWLLSIALPHQPHFIGQPADAYVCWGYGLFPDKEGDFVKKKMSECSGEEILTELCYQLGFAKELPAIVRSATCIPCMMPYITSQFMPRSAGDRPAVIPKGSTNFAFIGQYCEIPEDIVFTMEYSVHSARIATYSLLGLDKNIPPIYKGQYDIKVLYDLFKTTLHSKT